jgi:succinate dehydrogenase / fumarate reductase, cytochrome b subunit
MNSAAHLFKSSLGKKYLMSISGFVLVFFIFTHMMGNFQIFFGPYWINTYGEFLHQRHEVLWPARIFLITMVILHIWAAFKLRAENKAARPVGYTGNPKPFAATHASRTIMMSGLIIGAFVIFHLLHYAFEVKAVNMLSEPLGVKSEALKTVDFGKLLDETGRQDVYTMIVLGFSVPVVAISYIVALSLLCLHLSHGMRAMFQSIGWAWSFGGSENVPNLLARWGAVFIFAIYVSIPVAVMCGYGRAHARETLERYVVQQAAQKAIGPQP